MGSCAKFLGSNRYWVAPGSDSTTWICSMVYLVIPSEFYESVVANCTFFHIGTIGVFSLERDAFMPIYEKETVIAQTKWSMRF